MTMYYFSATTLGFYPEEMKAEYEAHGTFPSDVVEVVDEVRDEYNFTPPAGKQLGSEGGYPAWVDFTAEQLINAANEDKRERINQANDYINSKQWPGKAAIGRLKDDELAQYNVWLDYLDALEAVDISTAPNINWPEIPEQQL
ncbi:tail fiber assembly protein [Escherichia coli]|uniref:tail fiber assembly protein n=1 Tax=Escherichia coli TaxID=562 RepID=UPI0035ABF1B8